MNMLHNPHYGNGSYCGYRICCRQCNPCNHSRCMTNTNDTSVIQGSFCEYTASLQINSGKSYSDNYPTNNARIITIFIKNTGENPIVVSLQNSPNGQDFTDDPQQLDLAPGQTGYLVPYIFSKYTRISASGTGAGTAYIWFQMQNHSYRQSPG